MTNGEGLRQSDENLAMFIDEIIFIHPQSISNFTEQTGNLKVFPDILKRIKRILQLVARHVKITKVVQT